MIRSVVALGAALAGGAPVSGVFDDHYSRIVDRPVSQVEAGLEHLDIREQPGARGPDAAAARGGQPPSTHARTPQGLVWTVMSGSRIAVRMFADLAPIDHGRRTMIDARVERGDAPDDFVSPAFRSTGLALGLFSTALEFELDELTLPPGDPAHCRALIEKFEQQRPSQDNLHRDRRNDAPDDTAAAVMTIGTTEVELHRNGCPADDDHGAFRTVGSPVAR